MNQNEYLWMIIEIFNNNNFSSLSYTKYYKTF